MKDEEINLLFRSVEYKDVHEAMCPKCGAVAQLPRRPPLVPRFKECKCCGEQMMLDVEVHCANCCHEWRAPMVVEVRK